MKKEAGFWAGFDKRAKEQLEEVEEVDPGDELDSSNEKKLKWNPNGGVDPRSPEAMQVHESVGMLTLPEDVDGASCGTCEHMRVLDPVTGAGFCTNPAIKTDVTRRMLCSQWSAPDVYRASEAMDPSSMVAAQMVEEARGLPQDPNDPASAGGDPGADPAAAGAAPPPEAGEQPAGDAAPAAGGPPAAGAPLLLSLPLSLLRRRLPKRTATPSTSTSARKRKPRRPFGAAFTADLEMLCRR